MDWMRVVFGIGICFFLSTDLRAQSLPSQIDLKAAYCIPLVKNTLGMLTSGQATISATDPELSDARQLMAKLVAEEGDKLRRLQLYIMPRVSNLDGAGLMAAMKSGEEDVSRLLEVAGICMTKCKEPKDKPSCIQQCRRDYDVFNRTKTCDNVDWLPF